MEGTITVSRVDVADTTWASTFPNVTLDRLEKVWPAIESVAPTFPFSGWMLAMIIVLSITSRSLPQDEVDASRVRESKYRMPGSNFFVISSKFSFTQIAKNPAVLQWRLQSGKIRACIPNDRAGYSAYAPQNLSSPN